MYFKFLIITSFDVPNVLRSRRAATDAAALENAEQAKNAAVEEVRVPAAAPALCSMLDAPIARCALSPRGFPAR